MRKIVTFLACLFFASLCWGQYTTKYTFGVYDVTSYLSTKNAWHLLPQGAPGGQICHVAGLATLTEGVDGYIACIGPGQYIYSTTAQGTWSEHTEMGNARSTVTASSASAIYSIGSTACSLAKWNGTAWVGLPGCLTMMQAVPDGSLVGINSPYTYLSVKGDGSDWASVPGGNYFTYVYAADKSTMCGIGSNGHVYTYDKNAASFLQMSAQPSGTMKGCALAQADPILLAWSTTGVVSLYNFTAGTWSTVTGLSASQIVSTQKGMTLALDLQGHPYHLNIYAGYFAATTSGSYGGCPIQTCQPGATHTLTIQAHLPSGLFGAQGKVTGSPQGQLSASSYDVAIPCDLFFDDPNAPGCVPTVDGQAHCDVSGATLATPGPVPAINSSVYGGTFSGGTANLVTESFVGGWGTTGTCNVIDACAPATSSFCGDAVAGRQETGIALGPDATAADSIAAFTAACDKALAPNAWKFYCTYENDDVNTCTCPKVVLAPLGNGTIECF